MNIEASGTVATINRSCMSDPSPPAILPSFTYSRSAIPIPMAHYDETQYEGIVQNSKEESGNGCVQERGAVKSEVNSDDSYAAQVKKVQQLKTKHGYIVSQRDRETEAVLRECEKKRKKVEEARKAKFEIEQSEQFQDLEDRDDQFVAKEESEFRVMFKDLCERMKKREENFEKLTDYFKKNSVSVVEEDAAETATETTPQPNEPDESKLLETPSHEDAFRVMLKHGIATSWRAIGTLLGVSTGQLEDIECSMRSDQDSLQKVTSVWLKSPAEYCTWKCLIKAVKYINRQKALEMKKYILRLKRGAT